MSGDNPDPPRQGFTAGRVLRRIYSIIGVYPSRSDLIEICSAFGWGPLTRREKRVKGILLARLESLNEQILPFLNSREGIEALEKSYIGIINREQKVRPPAMPVEPLPAYASVSFYLNQPKINRYQTI
jgi:hypothetical protein